MVRLTLCQNNINRHLGVKAIRRVIFNSAFLFPPTSKFCAYSKKKSIYIYIHEGQFTIFPKPEGKSSCFANLTCE